MSGERWFAIRRLRPGWILLLAGLIFTAFVGLSWWAARATIRETRQLGGWTAVAPGLSAVEPFAIDGLVQQIGFAEKPITSEFLDHVVTDLTSLSTITLVRCRISNADLQRLREISTLKVLNLQESDADDATAAVLAGLEQVQHLALDRSRVTDAALVDLSRLPNLTYLGLSHTAVGDVGLAALSGHSSLRSLDLSHTNVTDNGLEHLRGLNLFYVKLDGTRVTPEGLARFRQGFRGTIIGGNP